MNSRNWPLVVAWGFYVASLFSPSATVPRDSAGWFDSETVAGWQAALWCIRMGLEGMSVRTWSEAFFWPLLWFWPLSNLLMWLTPVALCHSTSTANRRWAIVMGAATLANASAFLVLDGQSGGFNVGYYLWCLSFLLATIGLGLLSVRSTPPVKLGAT